ncbi:RidA family protein [Terrarubrum flagellatum]|uniref:RidA family protein n=1 Tax=Terrirubrum flagellatum TaxID=2895980 RepID=UPI0031453138
MLITRADSNGRRSRAVVHNSTVYLAGQVADDHSAPIEAQTEQALAKVDDMLARCGSDRAKILSAIIWLKSMNDYSAMNKVWDHWVDPDHAPARACVTGDMAYPDILVEIMVVAAA